MGDRGTWMSPALYGDEEGWATMTRPGWGPPVAVVLLGPGHLLRTRTDGRDTCASSCPYAYASSLRIIDSGTRRTMRVTCHRRHHRLGATKIVDRDIFLPKEIRERCRISWRRDTVAGPKPRLRLASTGSFCGLQVLPRRGRYC